MVKPSGSRFVWIDRESSLVAALLAAHDNFSLSIQPPHDVVLCALTSGALLGVRHLHSALSSRLWIPVAFRLLAFAFWTILSHWRIHPLLPLAYRRIDHRRTPLGF